MKGYITIEYEGTKEVAVEDVVDQVSDDILREEAIKRGIISKDGEGNRPLFSCNKDENRRAMCDSLGLNYHTSKEDIINELKTRL